MRSIATLKQSFQESNKGIMAATLEYPRVHSHYHIHKIRVRTTGDPSPSRLLYRPLSSFIFLSFYSVALSPYRNFSLSASLSLTASPHPQYSVFLSPSLSHLCCFCECLTCCIYSGCRSVNTLGQSKTNAHADKHTHTYTHRQTHAQGQICFIVSCGTAGHLLSTKLRCSLIKMCVRCVCLCVVVCESLCERVFARACQCV